MISKLVRARVKFPIGQPLFITEQRNCIRRLAHLCREKLMNAPIRRPPIVSTIDLFARAQPIGRHTKLLSKGFDGHLIHSTNTELSFHSPKQILSPIPLTYSLLIAHVEVKILLLS